MDQRQTRTRPTVSQGTTRGEDLNINMPQVSSPDETESSSSSSTLTPSPPIHAPQPQRRPIRRYPSNLSHAPHQTPQRRPRDESKYENLEDLLREAGYKETRVFTPESERQRKPAPPQESGILGFLSGLISRPTTPTPAPGTPSRQATPVDDDPTPRSSRIMYLNEPLADPAFSSRTSLVSSRLRERPSQSSFDRPASPRPLSRLAHSYTSDDASFVVHAPRPTRAVAQLRHMASNASVQSARPRSTPPARQRSLRSLRPNVLSTDPSRPAFAQINRGRTNAQSSQKPHPRGRPPAHLLPGGRSKSLVSVSKVGVVCRSEPASPARKTSMRGRFSKNKNRENVPSLRAHHDEPHLDELVMPPSSTMEDDDDEDDVLDLARILVPPKRQNSIASLRRHLITPQIARHRKAVRAHPEESEEGYSEDEQDFRRLISGTRGTSMERRRLGLPKWTSSSNMGA